MEIKLRKVTDITERPGGRNAELIFQSLEIFVIYDNLDQSVEVDSVYLNQNGQQLAEISKLLSRAEGNPLNAIIAAINWGEIYASQYENKRHSAQRQPGLKKIIKNPFNIT